MKSYNIITLGPSGAGKTVFLASLFKQLSTQGEYGFYLEAENPQQQNLLNTYYTEIITGEAWPTTTRGVPSEWSFTCRVKNPENLIEYPACQFTYKDYPGAMLSDMVEDESTNFDFQRVVDEADAVIALLDGQKVLSFLQGSNDRLLQIWLYKELPTLFQLIQRCRKVPVHFIITKWDLIFNQGFFDLSDVRHRLSRVGEFKNVVKQRIEAGCPVRIIPISSVGMDFATFEDGSMKKIPGATPRPFQVEVPLACVLIDGLKAEMKSAEGKMESIKQRSTKVAPKFSFLDQVNQFVSTTVLSAATTTARSLLPEKYKFDNETLTKLLELTEKGIYKVEKKVQNTREAVERLEAEAARESKKLRLQQENELKKVGDETTALNCAITGFIKIEKKLNREYPASDLQSTDYD